MLNFTPLARPYFKALAARRGRSADARGLEETQRRVLAALLRSASRTEIGRTCGFASMDSYADYASVVPMVQYEDIRPQVERMIAGESDVLWRGKTRRYAQSSGTSGGKSKYIPVTDDSLRLNHYRGGAESVASYLSLYPDSRMFAGKGLILGGSFANEVKGLPAGVKVGDLSANLIDAINPLANFFRVPSKEVALMSDWTGKLPALVRASASCDITNISGVPSWFLTVLRSVVESRGADTIHDVWPNLEVFFHGGISFAPYRSQYESITDSSKMRYIENYNASEGFFAVQDTRDAAAGMLLLADAGVFYEFVPFDAGSGIAGEPVPAWEVEEGKVYELIITASNGLWRYSPGDTVRIESTQPLRISIAGRTNSYINTFGEEVMVWNTDAALAEACRRTGAHAANYTAAPVYTEGQAKGHHQWLVEWDVAPACGNEAFADILDRELQRVNSDYQAKRSGDIFLGRLELLEVPAGTFDRWLASTGRLGGQRKVPRLFNDRHIVDPIIRMCGIKENTNS